MKRSYPSPALVIACLALFVAMGGTGYAATQLPSGKSTATASKSKAKRGRQGPRGPQGPQGLQGIPGTPGPPGKAGNNAFGALHYVTGEPGGIPPGEQLFVSAQCESGLHAVGGGVLGGAAEVGENVNSSFPGNEKGEPATTGWVVSVNNTTAKEQTAQAYVICTEAGTVTGL
jgi:hypothetical protein